MLNRIFFIVCLICSCAFCKNTIFEENVFKCVYGNAKDSVNIYNCDDDLNILFVFTEDKEKNLSVQEMRKMAYEKLFKIDEEYFSDFHKILKKVCSNPKPVLEQISKSIKGEGFKFATKQYTILFYVKIIDTGIEISTSLDVRGNRYPEGSTIRFYRKIKSSDKPAEECIIDCFKQYDQMFDKLKDGIDQYRKNYSK